MDRFPIIAIASAGDLEAVSELLSAFPGAGGEALVIVQCLNPARRDVPLAERLADRTQLPVVEAQDDLLPERGHVYVIRENTTLTITAGRMSVIPGTGGRSRPGDTLFTSLAEHCGNSAIGVVLSGGGSDGALGVQAIKRAGGTTFAQYPGSARFPSMPISAIETGCVRSVLLPYEIARELTRLSRIFATPGRVGRRLPLISASAMG
jgi:two-component system CheB/CheR fusion protein